MASHFLWQVVGPYCFKPFIISRRWLKEILPHILIKPFLNSYSEHKGLRYKMFSDWYRSSINTPNSFIMFLYNSNRTNITYYRANKTASMLLSGYKCSTTNFHSCFLRKGLGFVSFWCLCLQCITYKYELKVSPLKNTEYLFIYSGLLKKT